MANFALPQAVQYDNTGAQMLSRMAQEKRQDARLREQARQADESRKSQLLQSINPDALSKDFDKTVVNKTIGELQTNVSSFLMNNPNASSIDLQTYIQGNVGKIAKWSANVTQTREAIKTGIANFNNKRGIDVGLLGAAATHNALYNPDGSLKTEDQLDPSQDWVGSTLKSNIGQFTNMQEVAEDIPKFMKTFEKNTEEFYEVDRQGRKLDSTKRAVTFNPQWQSYNKDTGVVSLKTVDKTGYVTEDIYDLFVEGGSPMDGYLENKANEVLQTHNNNPIQQKTIKVGGIEVADPGNKELLKRAILSNYLAKTMSSDSKLEIKDETKPTPLNVTINGEKDVKYIKAFDELDEMYNDKKSIFINSSLNKRDSNGSLDLSKVIGYPINNLKPYVAKSLLKLANVNNTGSEDKYTFKNTLIFRDDKGQYGLYEVDEKNKDKDKKIIPARGQKIFNIDKYTLDDAVNEGKGIKVENKITNDNQTPAANKKPKLSFLEWQKINPKGTFLQYTKSI